MSTHRGRGPARVGGDLSVSDPVPPRIQELIGVGVGPGDPELVTLKAVRMVRGADVVVVPVSDGREAGPGRAEAIVREHVEAARLIRVPFAMAEPPVPPCDRVTGNAPEHERAAGTSSERERVRDAAAHAVLEVFDGGASTVVFVTLGDPNVYSTFTHLARAVRRLRPGVRVTTEPGITAMQDLASRSGTVLCEGREPLTLLPMTAGPQTFVAAVAGPGTVVAYKGWRQMTTVTDALRCHDRLDGAVVGSDLGLPGESITPVSGMGADLPYLSTVIVPARRDGETTEDIEAARNDDAARDGVGGMS